jgi:hypothetical protein
VLRELLGPQVEREYGLYNPDGRPYVFLVPPDLHARLSLAPERSAELNRRSREPGKTTPLGEVITRLESMQ